LARRGNRPSIAARYPSPAEVVVTEASWCFFSPHGRLNRQEFILAFLLLVVANAWLEHGISEIRFGDAPVYYHSQAELARPLWAKLVRIALLFWPLCAILVKRIHDLGWAASAMVVWFGGVMLLSFEGYSSAAAMLAQIGIVVLMLLKGSTGPNRFGAEPGTA
jgi:uncharacterized membrane protein YhaH (DUF805 family)